MIDMVCGPSAAKDGIGKCVTLCDCVGENSDDLMFLKVLLSSFFCFLCFIFGTG